jgi:hypothetical protein
MTQFIPAEKLNGKAYWKHNIKMNIADIGGEDENLSWGT